MPQVEIVLVRPETPVNIGAIARVIRNTGLDSLTLVSPSDWRTVECWRTAWKAQDILEQARVVTDLVSALAGSALSAALTRRRAAVSRDIREVASEIATLGPDQRAALVFGPETSGLTNPELVLCGRRAYLPTHPAHPSLNLSHAVMVAGYEVLRAVRKPSPEARRATHDEKQSLLALLRDGLLGIEAMPRTNSDSYFKPWRTLIQRADLTPKELRLLEHMARKMLRFGKR